MAVDDRPHAELDWEAVERWPEFQELVRRRRSFVVPAVIFYLAWYMAFILLCGYAPDFMAERVYEGLTVGYLLALTQFVMVGALGLWYLRKADRDFDPVAAAVVRQALQAGAEGDGRFRHRHLPGSPTEPGVEA
jgi:uncharacterized membrane protein (DUF485 family)